MNKTMKWAAGIAALALLLAADTALTWRCANGNNVVRASSAEAYAASKTDPLDSFRLEREQLRAREEAQLNDIIHSQTASAQIVSQAQARLMELMSCASAENAIEGVLRSRGFQDALVSVSSNSANVLIRGETPTQQQTAVILDLVMRQTGLTGGNVKIIPVK